MRIFFPEAFIAFILFPVQLLIDIQVHMQYYCKTGIGYLRKKVIKAY